MISFDKKSQVFHLLTKNTSYVMNIFKTKHLGHLYYGKKLSEDIKVEDMIVKFDLEVGNQVIYEQTDKSFNLNLACFELSTYGKGDFKEPSLHIRYPDGSRISDFLFKNYEILKQKPEFSEMPEAKQRKKEAETLVIRLEDIRRNLEISLYYSVFFDIDIITRRIVIKNNSKKPVMLEKALSMNLDMINNDFWLTTFDGAWIKERFIHRQKVMPGIIKIDSKKGVSSSDHNPFFVIANEHTTEEYGKAYGFGLIYSGNFEAVIERSPHDIIRVQMGINSFDFYWNLESEKQFVTPETVLSFSENGFNGLSLNYHRLIKQNIIKPDWNESSRPVLFNNWEATMFDFNQRKIINLAKKAKKLGIELFCLDDGWFGKRDNDQSSLGDWQVNFKKIPKGIKRLAKKINDIGLDFGIWVEPEMVNPDSNLFRVHPDWVIKHPSYKPSLGRNQLVLDLTKKEVRDYLYNVLSKLFDNANIKYCKWDMNRNMSDIFSDALDPIEQGKFFHLYQLGLYELLERLTSAFPEVLFESCSSGGNRFDMGMLYYMPQIWTSDNTDGYTRQLIQYGTSYLYPQSVMGAHVSQSPSITEVRKTPLETRFNINAFGLLGYELDITKLTKFEEKVIKKQIKYYKDHRSLFQFGEMYRVKNPFFENGTTLVVTNPEKTEAILGVFKTLENPNGGLEKFPMEMLRPELLYKIENRPQYFNLKKFGHLVKYALPIKLNTNGVLFNMLSNHYLLETEKVDLTIKGDRLVNQGFIPQQNFIGSGFDENVRLMGDFGSRMYHFKAIEEEKDA